MSDDPLLDEAPPRTVTPAQNARNLFVVAALMAFGVTVAWAASEPESLEESDATQASAETAHPEPASLNLVGLKGRGIYVYDSATNEANMAVEDMGEGPHVLVVTQGARAEALDRLGPFADPVDCAAAAFSLTENFGEGHVGLCLPLDRPLMLERVPRPAPRSAP